MKDKTEMKSKLKVYAITDSTWLNGKTLESQVELAIKGGATIVQLREKNKKGDELKELAKRVLLVCRKYNVPLIINDDPELAKEIDADGVHVGQKDMSVLNARQLLGPDKIIGATAKTIEQAKEAMKQGANYLGSGAVFGSTTKTDAVYMSKELLNDICNSVDIPVVAIGGITAENMLELKGAKIAGVAVVSGIFAQEDITLATSVIAKNVEELFKENIKC